MPSFLQLVRDYEASLENEWTKAEMESLKTALESLEWPHSEALPEASNALNSHNVQDSMMDHEKDINSILFNDIKHEFKSFLDPLDFDDDQETRILDQSFQEISIEESFDKKWLLNQCQDHIANFMPDSGLHGTQLCTDLFDLLRSKRNGSHFKILMAFIEEDIQGALVDLLGFENLAFALAVKLSNEPPPIAEAPAEAKRPIYGAQVTVMSQSEKKLAKLQRKELKKHAKHANTQVEDMTSASILDLDGEYLKNAREQQLAANMSAPMVANPGISTEPIKYPHVYQSGSGGSVLSLFGTRFSLPAMSERIDNKDYEQVTIPITEPSATAVNQKRISIQTLDPFAQRAFRGYKSLNRVQSIVFPIAHGTNENMLVCAPTGAGKTDIAMLTVLRCVDQFRSGDLIAKNDFKIVYIAPMKALATEITKKFATRLGGRYEDGGLGLTVKELTGDMQLTKAEISATQMLVVTPEKFDVVGRKSMGDTELMQKVRLLIIDEVHLLNEDRGSVIETIVARTQRLVESSQSMIRIVGLSATLPNYVDVASFLGVNPYRGLFYFDSSFRPVPLEQHFIGVKGKASSLVMRTKMSQICYEKISSLVKDGRQVMVFVHARKETVKTAQEIRQEAASCNEGEFFSIKEDPQYHLFAKEVQKSKNKELRELFDYGLGIHHAGMARTDRLLTERLFEKGLLKVLCCTSTLAWGVNLPAYAVVIKGTQVYDATKGTFVDLSILDVLQIFGRAGRPQYEDRGLGFIITSHDKLAHYISAVTQQFPIESRFAENLTDNLNAEISLGTVTNLDEAIRWLSYTYLYVRMRKNPFHYGLNWKDIADDPTLAQRRRDLIIMSAKTLSKAQMIIFDDISNTGYLTAKDLGRTASSFYIRTLSVEIFNTMMRPRMTEADVLSMLSMSTEFENIKVREEEIIEMKKLERKGCACDVKGGVDTHYGKSNILLQCYISRAPIEDFALNSDSYYVSQNASRILRGLFQIAMSRNWGPTASVILSLCKSVDKRMWTFESVLKQFDLPYDILQKLETIPEKMDVEHLREMDEKELGQLIRNMRMGSVLKRCAHHFPTLSLDAQVAPITRTVLKISLTITSGFQWNDKIHGFAEPFWIWVEDSENTDILYSEYLLVTKKQYLEPQMIEFTIPLPQTHSTKDALPPQIFIRAVSDRWIGSETILPVSFKHLILPAMDRTSYTDLLDLQPLPISALKDPISEEICRKRFAFFNPVQTQIFHTMYNTAYNVLIGAPTGSGKTVAAEIALWAAFRDRPKSKVVYIAPLKALVKERVNDWTKRIARPMNRRLIELTGDITPDLRSIENADIIVTTPEKWDGISRSWQTRSYVKSVSLVIIDEIHLLGNERGPILEVIVSRMNYIAAQTKSSIRVVGLSTALANANDLADWLGIEHVGLYNFRHSVRPVPLDIYIEGFPGKHYCPRMMSMNKPAYKAIMTHAPDKPVIIFVSSRRQTRLTAQDLISLCANDDNPKRFTKISEDNLETLLEQVNDPALGHSLAFGIGLHHAGLVEKDRQLVEELFVNGKIQVLVATSTLAWGVNYPAHLVIVKGTEFFDAKRKGYVDYPITDVLQMMGRAGRIQFSDSGVACIFVQDTKKDFYKKFLHEPFPVESSLHKCLTDHLNAEIMTGSITNKQDAVDYLTWTYLYRRMQMNPTYYGAEDSTDKAINEYLSKLIEHALQELASASCIEILGDFEIEPSPLGKIASYYYLNYRSMRIIKSALSPSYSPKGDILLGQREDGDFPSLLRILCNVCEYEELPVRHNEDIMNKTLEKQLSIPLQDKNKTQSSFGGPIIHVEYDDPHCKAFLLLQAHLERLPTLPCSDYITDTNSVLDQSIRIIQAMLDVCLEKGYLSVSLGLVNLMQCLKQALWTTDSSLLCLPHIKPDMLPEFEYQGQLLESIAQLKDISTMLPEVLSKIPGLGRRQRDDIISVIKYMPVYVVSVEIREAKKTDTKWVLDCGQKYEVFVRMKRLGPHRDGFAVYAPRFPKAQTEGYFVILGDPQTNDLLDLRRVSPVGRRASDDMSVTFKFVTPPEPGAYHYVLNIMSDGYIGLDQEIDLEWVQ